MKNSELSIQRVLALALTGGLLYASLPRRSYLRRGQVAVITGGSRGLGLALARHFGKAGLKLVLAAEDRGELEDAQRKLLESGDVRDSRHVLLFAGDLTEREHASRLVEATIDGFGQLDVLINNAGIIEVGPIENIGVEVFERTMQVNFFAALYMTKAALPYLLGRGEGAIVNIASIGGKLAVPHLLPYVAAKFALTGFSEGLHAEVRRKGVRVTTVCPGLMRTGGEVHAHFHGDVEKEKVWFQTSARIPGLSADVDHAARRIVSAVRQGRAEITITPQAWLAARFAGLAPSTTQALSSLISSYVLPDAQG